MFKKKEAPKKVAPIETTVEPTHEIVEVDTVVDRELTKAKGYLTDERLNETSKRIRYPSPTDGELKWFTKI